MTNRRRQNNGKIPPPGAVTSSNMSERSRTAVEIAQDEEAVENEHYPGITLVPSSLNIFPAQRPPGAKPAGRISTATMLPTTHSSSPTEQYATRRRQNEERRYGHIKKKKRKPQIKASAHRREPQSAHHAERPPGTSASTWQDTDAMIPPLRELLEYDGMTSFGDEILLGTCAEPVGLSDAASLLLPELEAMEPYLTGPPAPEWFSIDSYKNGWKNWSRERTASGPSNLTPAMFRVECEDEELVQAGYLSAHFPWLTGYSPHRWRHGIDLLIQKKLGSFLASGLRPILLFDVDCNMHNKRLGRLILRRAEACGGLAPEQYGSRRHKAADVQALNTRLFFDYTRLRRCHAIAEFIDLQSNYDLVVHSIASLCMQRVGTPKEPIICTFTTLRESALYRSMDEDSRIKSKQKQFDMIMAIRAKIERSPLEWKYRHVHGHQDRKSGLSFEKMDRWGQLNMIVDRLAGERWNEEAAKDSHRIQQDIEGEGWRVFLQPKTRQSGEVSILDGGIKMSNKLIERLESVCLGQQTIDYWVKKKQFPRRYQRHIDWSMLGLAATRMKHTKAAFVTKFIANHGATASRLFQRGQVVSPECPRGCGEPWQLRNYHMNPAESPAEKKAIASLRVRITHHWRRTRRFLPKRYRFLFENPLESLLAKPTYYQRTWLRTVVNALSRIWGEDRANSALGTDMEILGLWIKGKVRRGRKLPPTFRTTDRKLPTHQRSVRRVLQDGTVCDTYEEYEHQILMANSHSLWP